MSRRPDERLPFPADAAARGRYPRAEGMGGRLDAARRGRGGAADTWSRFRLETDRGTAAAVGARWTPVRLVSDRVSPPRPCWPCRFADRRRLPGHPCVAQRQAPGIPLWVLRAVRVRPDALFETREPSRDLLRVARRSAA